MSLSPTYLVNSLHKSGHDHGEDLTTSGFLCELPNIQQVDTFICEQRPIVVLARSVGTLITINLILSQRSIEDGV